MRASSSSSDIASARISCSVRLLKLRMRVVPSIFRILTTENRVPITTFARGQYMRLHTLMMGYLVPSVVVLPFVFADEKKSDDTGITWKKTVLDRRFVSE